MPLNIENFPVEEPRIELKDLPEKADLVIVNITEKEAVLDKNDKKIKTGGLLIKYKMRDERTFTQKYSSRFASILKESLVKLGYKTTEQLETFWHSYEQQKIVVSGTSGTIYPRMFPVKKLEKYEPPTETEAELLTESPSKTIPKKK